MTTAVLGDAPPDATSRWREWVPSIAAASLVAGFLLITPRVVAYTTMPGGGTSWSTPGGADQFTVVAGLSVVVGVALGRRWPVWGTALTFLPFLQVPWNGGFAWGWWLGILAVAALAALDGLRRAIVPTTAALLVAVWYCGTETPAYLPIGPVTSGSGSTYEWVTLAIYTFWLLAVVGVAAAFGTAQRSRRREAGAAVTEQHALQIESLAGERARLARDLHDVVAHHVSLVAVRAESAPYLHPGLNDDAREVLAAIALDAREALTELRQVLVVLQRTSDEGDRTPQPTACDVDTLVASAVAAGQSVEMYGAWRDVPPAVGYVMYRAVQEGLTNARRHAPGTTTTLTRTQTEDTAGFLLSNPASGDTKEGRGLIGMRERVEALGGTMTAVIDDEKFVLEIVVPT
ncbi:sensor histidine kinase [Cellulomonas sp. P5_E12]